MHKSRWFDKAPKLGVFVTSLAHFALYGCNIYAILMFVLHEPWYYAMMVLTFFYSPAMSGIYCVFNNTENYYRSKAGMETIPDDWMSFYLRKLSGGKGTIIKIKSDE